MENKIISKILLRPVLGLVALPQNYIFILKIQIIKKGILSFVSVQPQWHLKNRPLPL